ncbi:hypothetical protein SO694_00121096 [Aureococcus anophagefferens]|uniref:HIT-type domain-containing protein n=1 Tax=Aureococcus anophagefferens TaxID=44056 RepID=A0ABR1G3Q1_AURAN
MSQSQESQWFGPSQDESQCDEDVTNTFKALPAHSAFVRLSQDSSFNDAAPTPADASGVTRITASASSPERGSARRRRRRAAPAATPRPAVAPPPPRAAATVCRPVAAPPADEPVPVCYAACGAATAPDLDDEGRQRVKPPSAKDVREKAPERLLWRCPQCEKTLIGCAYRCGACYTLANFTGCRRHETHKCRRNPSRASDGAAAAVPHAAAVVESESSSESSDDGREGPRAPRRTRRPGVFASLRAPASRPFFLFRDDAVPSASGTIRPSARAQRQWAAEAPPADDDADRWSDGSGFALPRRESVDAVEAAPPRDGGDDDFPASPTGGGGARARR